MLKNMITEIIFTLSLLSVQPFAAICYLDFLSQFFAQCFRLLWETLTYHQTSKLDQSYALASLMFDLPLKFG